MRLQIGFNCEHCNEPSGFINHWIDHQLLNKELSKNFGVNPNNN